MVRLLNWFSKTSDVLSLLIIPEVTQVPTFMLCAAKTSFRLLSALLPEPVHPERSIARTHRTQSTSLFMNYLLHCFLLHIEIKIRSSREPGLYLARRKDLICNRISCT